MHDVGLEREKEIKIRLEKRPFNNDEVSSCLDVVYSPSKQLPLQQSGTISRSVVTHCRSLTPDPFKWLSLQSQALFQNIVSGLAVLTKWTRSNDLSRGGLYCIYMDDSILDRFSASLLHPDSSLLTSDTLNEYSTTSPLGHISNTCRSMYLFNDFKTLGTKCYMLGKPITLNMSSMLKNSTQCTIEMNLLV